MIEDKVFLGQNVSVICKDNDCTVFQMKDETGEGLMTTYKVFPGVYLMYNDYHMKSCISEFKPHCNMFSINHCNEGRMEWDVGDGAYLYLREGDLKIDNCNHHTGNYSFPLTHYHGISILLCVEEATKSLNSVLYGFPVDLIELQKKYCDNKKSYVIRGEKSIAHIFSELYAVPSKIKKYYFKIKVLELLLYLSALELQDEELERPYFYKTQVEKIKAMEKLITSDLETHYTLDQLSARFDISLTSMKTCFKGVYGTSIYAYLRTYRMNRAAVLLRQSKDNIAYIAGCVGYDSPSKFAYAFKSIMGKSPLEYRKSIV
ncbi:helix-turn-helix domain-containing protein [Vallitalea guaymasensis]|uniref:helix-turn-helix domain-containing protein n=1 Tax=Vallitalea guaymasensis TaxID=1185412 RepID=UPI00272D9510|nr:AraC family transcriptional regulator [Vallitalea guaymasensis]